MIDYIVQTYFSPDVDACFQFRTQKSTSRFQNAIDDGFMKFTSEKHRQLFLSTLASQDFSYEEKLIVLFWQLAYANRMFNEVTDSVYLRALYAGRISISLNDVLAYIQHLKTLHPEEITWGDPTLKTIASKYLTLLKKFGLADGKLIKEICHPHITSNLFTYLVRFALYAYPETPTLDNPMFRFSLLENSTIINRLKTIEYIQLWDITQIGNQITIALKS